MVRYPSCFVIFIAVSTVLCCEITATAGPKKTESKKVRFMKYAAAQLPNAQRAAGRAKAALASAVGEVRAAGQALQAATAKLDGALGQLALAEKTAFQNLADDDPFWEFWTRYEETRDEYQAAVRHAVHSKPYKTALAKLRSRPDYGDLMAELRQETLERDAVVITWRTRMRLAKSAVEAARRRIVDADDQWGVAAFIARKAREDVKLAEQRLDYALTRRMAARGPYHEAARAAAIAAAARQQLQQGTTTKPAGTKTSTGSLSKYKD